MAAAKKIGCANRVLRRQVLLKPSGFLLVEAEHAHDQPTRDEQDCVLQLGALDLVIVPSTLAVTPLFAALCFRGGGAKCVRWILVNFSQVGQQQECDSGAMHAHDQTTRNEQDSVLQLNDAIPLYFAARDREQLIVITVAIRGLIKRVFTPAARGRPCFFGVSTEVSQIDTAGKQSTSKTMQLLCISLPEIRNS
jgi:hypothetical protein